MQPSATGRALREHLTGTHLMFNLHYQANGKASHGQNHASASGSQKGPITHASQGPGGGDFGSETFIVNGKELTGRFSAQVTQDILPPRPEDRAEHPCRRRQLSLWSTSCRSDGRRSCTASSRTCTCAANR